MSWARVAGVCLQALILGTALFLAIANLVAASGGARIFRYQNF